jgi:D-aminoacyl-tRNA deacylase
MSDHIKASPIAICFGGTHYPDKFTNELLEGIYSLGTVVPNHALDNIDDNLFFEIVQKNQMATAALLDWGGLGPNKQKILELLKKTQLEVIRL